MLLIGVCGLGLYARHLIIMSHCCCCSVQGQLFLLVLVLVFLLLGGLVFRGFAHSLTELARALAAPPRHGLASCPYSPATNPRNRPSEYSCRCSRIHSAVSW